MLLGAWSLLFPSAAQADDAASAPPTLAGSWTASSLSETWTTSSWGEACGPKPGGQGAPGGSVQIAQQGSELTFSGAGRTFSTAQCWDQTPGMVRASHSAGARGWITRCTSPKGDPRVVTVTTNITATDDTIVLVEQGQYQFVIQDTTCSASATRRRSWKLVQRAGEAPPAPAASAATPPSAPVASSAPPPPSPPPPPPAAPAATRCEPGEPTRLEVFPGRKLVRPGDAFDLTWKATDERSCPVPVRPAFRVHGDVEAVTRAVQVSEAGRVTIQEGAPQGRAEITVTLAGRAARVSIEIADPERFDDLLAERGLDPLGDGEAAIVVLEGAVGGQRTSASGTAADRRTAFIAVVVGAAAALALAALIVLRKNRRPAPVADRPSVVTAAPLVALYDRPAADDPMRCPQCREVFPAGEAFCPTDGVPLVPAPKARVAPARQTPAPPPVERGKVCPTCGARYDEASQFCGRDGTQLVVVN